MLGLLLGSILLLAMPVDQATQAPSAHSPVATQRTEDGDPSPLLKLKRIYVDSFGDDLTSRELYSKVVSALVATKRFKVTENRDRADVVLKGVALEKRSQEVRAYGETTVVRGAGVADSSVKTETIDEARLSIRLVNSDGDIIWTTTQESKGAKYMGASADVADKCVKRLVHDVEMLEKGDPPATPTAPLTPASTQHK